MLAIYYTLENPIPIPGSVKHRARRCPRVWYDPRQLAFDGVLEEPRAPRLRLDQISIDSCRALWAEVLRTGIQAFLRDEEGPGSTCRDEDDKHWFIYDVDNSKREHVGSFRFCCNVLGLDCDIIRQGVMAKARALGD